MMITVDTVMCKSITLSFQPVALMQVYAGGSSVTVCDIQLALALSQIRIWFRGRIMQAETEDHFTYIT